MTAVNSSLSNLDSFLTPLKMSQSKVFVTGATGQQGGSVVRALLGSKKFTVNALVRDVNSPASQSLKMLGATLIQGDWDDLPAIEKAAAGCNALFLNSYPSHTDSGAELRQAQNILTAAKSAGIKQVIYSRHVLSIRSFLSHVLILEFPVPLVSTVMRL